MHISSLSYRCLTIIYQETTRFAVFFPEEEEEEIYPNTSECNRYLVQKKKKNDKEELLSSFPRFLLRTRLYHLSSFLPLLLPHLW
jgi:hypothetical protein